MVKGIEFEVKAAVGPVDGDMSLRLRSGANKKQSRS